MVPGSARNWIAINPVRQSKLNKNLKAKNMTTLHLRKSVGRSPLRHGFLLVALALGALVWGQPVSAQEPAPRDLESFVKYVQSHHRAPFDREGAVLPKGEVLRLQVNANAPFLLQGTNVKVNQDRNPWPKAEIAAAVDPTNGNNYVVMSNDFRENYDHQFYHVSTTGGATWTDDSMVGGADPSRALFLLHFRAIRAWRLTG